MAKTDEHEIAHPTAKRSTTFSLRSILVIMTVAATAAFCFGNLFKAAAGDPKDIGPFVISTAVAPLALMVAVSWTLRIWNWLTRSMRSRSSGPQA